MYCIFNIILIVVMTNPTVTEQNEYLTDSYPEDYSLVYFQNLIPQNKLIHSGVFSPDLMGYYFTVSDKSISSFDVLYVKKEDDKWSTTEEVFFNSKYFEHGTSFSPDGKIIYFSSTRPVTEDEVANTWPLWKSKKNDDEWSEPEYIDIQNLKDKLVSHPSVSDEETLYFHSANPDYSDMFIYKAELTDSGYSNAEKLPPEINFFNRQNTPFIARDESYLLFESDSRLSISFQESKANWIEAKPLSDSINKHCHGNPYVTRDQKYLFYVAGSEPKPDDNWAVFWISTKDFLNNSGQN